MFYDYLNYAGAGAGLGAGVAQAGTAGMSVQFTKGSHFALWLDHLQWSKSRMNPAQKASARISPNSTKLLIFEPLYIQCSGGSKTEEAFSF